MSKGIGQGGAWVLSILVSSLLFAGILTLVLSIEQRHQNSERMPLTQESDEYEITSEDPDEFENTSEDIKHHDKAKEKSEDGEHEIKSDDEAATVPKSKKKHYGLIQELQGRLTGQT